MGVSFKCVYSIDIEGYSVNLAKMIVLLLLLLGKYTSKLK